MSVKIAEERIERLFELAERRIEKGDERLADRYVEIARNIGMTYSISVQSDLKKRFCSNCNTFLKPGFNCNVRFKSENQTVNYRCQNCGNTDRYGYGRDQK